MKHNELVEIIENQTGEKPKQREIAEALGNSVSVIGKRAERNSSYDFNELSKINEYFGMKYFEFNLFESANTNRMIKNVLNKTTDDNTSIMANYYPEIFGSCGTGTFVPAEYKERIHVPKHCIHNYSKGKNYSVINARGDSMQPYIQDKDLLIFEDYDGEQICDNRIYVFRYGDKIFVKRLILNINQLIIKSDNPAPEYKTITIDLTENTNIQIIGKFAGLMRKAE